MHPSQAATRWRAADTTLLGAPGTLGAPGIALLHLVRRMDVARRDVQERT